MATGSSFRDIVDAGDIDGRSRVYDAQGNLVTSRGESILRISHGWDMSAQSPWRRLLPTIIFLGFKKPASSRLYVTTERIVLIRDIDPARETVGEMTPLGMPNAVARAAELKRLKISGVRQFCEVHPAALQVSRVRRSRTGGTWVGLDLIGRDGTQYALSYWKTDGEDHETLALIESQFRSSGA